MEADVLLAQMIDKSRVPGSQRDLRTQAQILLPVAVEDATKLARRYCVVRIYRGCA